MATKISIKCQPIKKTLDNLKSELEALQNELNGSAGSPTRPKPEIIKDIGLKNKEIGVVQAELDECIRKNPLPPPPVIVAPQHILETNFKNPEFDTSDPDWAKKFAGGGTAPFGTFPLGSDREWKQVLAPDEDYDYDKVGASGWVAGDPKLADKDFPFNHPFSNFQLSEFDWKFGLALDDQYKSLSSESNGTAEVGEGTFSKLTVEMERNLVPASFQKKVKKYDRAVIFGRWVIDCGHDDFKAEVHPPLLMAIASPTDPDKQNLKGSKAIFTSRPYLVSQKFTTDTDTIYKDEAEDDGFFLEHAIKELTEILTFVPISPLFPIPRPLSVTLAAHPKIKSKPFQGILLASIIVRPTSRKPELPPSKVNVLKLAVSYNFTIRTGCAVQVIPHGEDGVRVIVVLNSAGYTAPPLPKRRDIKFDNDDIDKLNKYAGIAHLFSPVLLPSVLPIVAPLLGPLLANPLARLNLTQAVARGVETDEYDDAPLQVNINHKRNQVNDVLASQIVQGAGITVDDNQPYPLYGWLEAKWVDTTPPVHP